MFTITGTPVAFIRNGTVFDFSARLLGYYSNGWIRDKNGYAVLFTDDHSGVGPIPPIHEIPPFPAIPSIPPIPPMTPIPPFPPIPSYSWSSISAEDFFYKR